MPDDDHFKQIGENFNRVFNLLDVLAVEVADVKATGKRTESKLDTHIIDTRAEFVRVGTEFERVDRRLGDIENRVESLETHAVRTDQRLESIETNTARTDVRLEAIETHIARTDGRLEGIETYVAHIDSTLLKLL